LARAVPLRGSRFLVRRGSAFFARHRMRTLTFVVAVTALCGCASQPTFRGADDKLVFSQHWAEADKFGVGDSRWYYIGTASGVQHFVKLRKVANGNLHIVSQVLSSEASVTEQFPLTYTTSYWRHIDSPPL